MVLNECDLQGRASTNQSSVRNVLLAADLSARGDRALERAVAIATTHQAQLTVLHVIEELDESNLTYRSHPTPSWRAPPDALQIAKLRIRQGLHVDLGDALERATIRIEDGEPAEVIERIAESEMITRGCATPRRALKSSRSPAR
jgi:nucleotide-binding universal stress UspA family protein